MKTDPTWINRDRVNASYVAWELPTLPIDWGSILRGLDVVLAPSRFVQKAIEDAVPEIRCLLFRQAVVIPEDVAADRARWQMPESAVVFVFSFDMASDIERKNPEALIEAFRKAFDGARRDVQLVIKVNSAPSAGAGTDERCAVLVSRITGDARICLITDVLSYREVLSLYASADVLVSLHRSEGLGRSMMEAMFLGRPAVATGWSGNMDYMTTENSLGRDRRRPGCGGLAWVGAVRGARGPARSSAAARLRRRRRAGQASVQRIAARRAGTPRRHESTARCTAMTAIPAVAGRIPDPSHRGSVAQHVPDVCHGLVGHQTRICTVGRRDDQDVGPFHSVLERDQRGVGRNVWVGAPHAGGHGLEEPCVACRRGSLGCHRSPP